MSDIRKFQHGIETAENGRNVYRWVWVEGCSLPDTYLNGRPVYFEDISHGEDSCDSYFEKACFADTFEDLNDDELGQLTEENAGHLEEEWFEHQVGRAEAWADRDR